MPFSQEEIKNIAAHMVDHEIRARGPIKRSLWRRLMWKMFGR
jgi:hypothetical protein